MAEMKNPQQQMGGQSWRVFASVVVIVMAAMLLQRGLRQRVNVGPKVQVSVRAEQAGPGDEKAAVPAVVVPAVVKTQAAGKRSGFLAVLARPLFVALNWIHRHVISNWGWAILVLTLGINVVLLPLRIRMMRSQWKTQRIQPEVAAIRERYKGCKLGDPRMLAMNKELSGLQRKHGVSVWNSIVPLLIQMPLLYGFYQMLHNAVELQHAPWLWLQDLSAADPLHILPIVFVVTMGLQQWLTPAPGTDAVQRKMMAVAMPVVYGVMAWHVSAGLALYWSGGTIFAIGQQMVFSRSRMG